jgi:TPR repeat protein
MFSEFSIAKVFRTTQASPMHTILESASAKRDRTISRPHFVHVGLLLLFACAGCGEPTPQAPPVKVDLSSLVSQAESGDPKAQAALGRAYMEGNGTPRSYQKAAEWLGRAADQTNVESMVHLAMLHQVGQGVPQSDAKALYWFQRACDFSNAVAAYSLGSIYANGRGVPQNSTTAARYYRTAADWGDPEAQYNMAQRYELGRGVQTNLLEALVCYELAAKGGVPDAKAPAARLRDVCSPKERAAAEAKIAEALKNLTRPNPR